MNFPLRQILTTSPGTQFSVCFFDYPGSFQHCTLLCHPRSSILSQSLCRWVLVQAARHGILSVSLLFVVVSVDS